MSRKHSGIMEELDLQDVKGFTEAQKNYYVSLGYKPYRNTSGRIKWLSPDLHQHRIYNIKKRSFFERLFSFPPKQIPFRRKHRPKLVKMIQGNWFFIIILIALAIFLATLIFFPHILIRS